MRTGFPVIVFTLIIVVIGIYRIWLFRIIIVYESTVSIFTFSLYPCIHIFYCFRAVLILYCQDIAYIKSVISLK